MSRPAPSRTPAIPILRWRWRLFLVALVGFTGLVLALDRAAAGDPYGDGIAAETDTVNADNVLDAPDAADAEVAATTGSLTVSFGDNVLLDGAGDDLTLHLPDDGDATADVLVSANGADYVSVGSTNDDGIVSFDIAGTGLGYVTHVRIANVSGGTFEIDAVEAVHDLDLDTTTVLLAQAEDENPGFTDHTVTAHVQHMAMVPVEDVEVAFAITSGPNAGLTGSASTDAAGDAPFTWTGEGGPGDDTVVAWLDLNGNGSADPDEPAADPVVKTWHGVTGVLTILDADRGGLVDGDLVQVLLTDRDLDTTDGQDTVNVHVESDSDAGFDLLLTETGDHSGEFVGFFHLGDELSAAENETITASYVDALNGEGEVDQEVKATIKVAGEEEDGLQVTICHRPPGNPGNQRTLTVGQPAVAAHLGHGDIAGECGAPIAPTKQEQAQERRAEREAERNERRAEREADFCERKGDDHPRCD